MLQLSQARGTRPQGIGKEYGPEPSEWKIKRVLEFQGGTVPPSRAVLRSEG